MVTLRLQCSSIFLCSPGSLSIFHHCTDLGGPGRDRDRDRDRQNISPQSITNAASTDRMGEEGIVLTLSDFHLSPMIFETNTTLEIGLCFNLQDSK